MNTHNAQQTNDRKSQHIHILQTDPAVERHGNHFDAIRLTHNALPELNLHTLDTTTTLLNKPLSFPFLISSMTGGDNQQLITLNQRLAEAAQHCQVGLAVGSQRIMLQTPQAEASFQLRSYAPGIPLIANIGAVQLNYGITTSQIQHTIDTLQADALYLHFNPLQEAIQPEGDTNFAGLLDKIHALSQALPVPIIAKEVGSGFSHTDCQKLLSAGVRHIDIAGAGGTSWSRIENHRRQAANLTDNLGQHFQDWGIPTPQAIQIAAHYPDLTIIASGGIRNGTDIAKSLILGASFGAAAAPLLAPAQHSTQSLIDTINTIKQQYTLTQFLLGAPTSQSLIGNHSLILP